jgi:alkaline phosphatase D
MIAQDKAQKVPKPDFKQYKRIHQKALDLIRTGKAGTAVKFLAAVEEKLPNDAETQYMLAVAQCTLGQAAAAEASAAKALKLGLPVGRIIGGSHNGLDAIRKRPLIQRLLEQHGKTPVHGPMIGNLSGNSATVWLRTADNATVLVEANTVPPTPGGRVSAVVQARREHDFVVKAVLNGLKPETKYTYTVAIDGKKKTRWPTSSLRRLTGVVRPGGSAWPSVVAPVLCRSTSMFGIPSPRPSRMRCFSLAITRTSTTPT